MYSKVGGPEIVMHAVGERTTKTGKGAIAPEQPISVVIP